MGKTIAIDGPSASGKSSVSKSVAAELGFIYVDSGALYRGVTWQAIRKGVDPKDEDAVAESMHNAEWDFFVEDGAAIFSVDDDIPVQELREKDVREAVADVAAMPEVRKFVVESLQSLASFGSLVMEGRDIGTVVFPDSPYKFYLDAAAEVRAQRRYDEMTARGEQADYQDVLDAIIRRDQRDRTRAADPLVMPEGAVTIDTSDMTIPQMVDAMRAHVEAQQ